MSVLSEKLKYFIDQKGLSIAELAKSSGIERSTLYQYIKDRRPLQNRAQLEAVMSELHLTPDERAEVLEAYEITRIGVKNYNRRRKVREIMESLLTIEEGKPEIVKAGQKKSSMEVQSQGLIRGELEVNRIVHQVIQETAERGGELKLLVQPDYDLVMESLMLVKGGLENTRVIHLICLEPDSGQDGCSNLESIRRVLRYGIGIRSYEPRYYYGRAKEHYGSMSVLPYLIAADRCAIQISSDRKAAVLHNEPRIVEYLNGVFDRMCQQSRLLMVSIDGFGGEQARWGAEYIRTVNFSNTYEMCSGLCSVQFWDERLIREYPAVFFAEPVSPADRRELIERILKAAEEGWYHIRMVPMEDFLLSYHWEIVIHQGSSMLFQYAFENQFRIFQIEEKDILDAVFDFMENMAAGSNVLDEVQSTELIRKWEKQYLA